MINSSNLWDILLYGTDRDRQNATSSPDNKDNIETVLALIPSINLNHLYDRITDGDEITDKNFK